jgi:hypothetical protein
MTPTAPPRRVVKIMGSSNWRPNLHSTLMLSSLQFMEGFWQTKKSKILSHFWMSIQRAKRRELHLKTTYQSSWWVPSLPLKMIAKVRTNSLTWETVTESSRTNPCNFLLPGMTFPWLIDEIESQVPQLNPIFLVFTFELYSLLLYLLLINLVRCTYINYFLWWIKW